MTSPGAGDRRSIWEASCAARPRASTALSGSTRWPSDSNLLDVDLLCAAKLRASTAPPCEGGALLDWLALVGDVRSWAVYLTLACDSRCSTGSPPFL